jgi:16S rRNA (cytidine1402-2'-O)-methyltransferase
VFFESPHRILRILAELEEIWGPRRVAVARELTKRFEEVLRGTAQSVRRTLEEKGTPRGEFVVVVEGTGRRKSGVADGLGRGEMAVVEGSGRRKRDR